MTQFAVARMIDRQPRFFQRYSDPASPLKLISPVTTGRPDQAMSYDDRSVAVVVCAVLNLMATLKAASEIRPWIVMELPEQWL